MAVATNQTEPMDAQVTGVVSPGPGWHAAATRTITSAVTLQANALHLPLRDGAAQCVVTSPPYLGQRVYGDDDQEIGNEGSVAHYIALMLCVAVEVRRILKDDGLFWLNIGDKANGSGGAGGDYNAGGDKDGKRRYGKFFDPEYERGQFLDIPGKLVTALQGMGWRLRSEIIWDKGQESRESLTHIRRPRVSHEKIFLLAPTNSRSRCYPERLPETGSVWHFPPAQRERKNHDAPFPDELARRCILASTDPGDIVVDPFVGSGTTLRVARELGRNAIGTDLYARSNPCTS